MLLPQLVLALEGVRQHLVPGGRFAAAVWSAPQKVPVLSLPGAVFRQFIEMPAPPVAMPGPFSLSDRNALEQAFAQAGFSEVHSELMELTLELASVSDYTELIRAVSPSVDALLASQSAEQQERLLQAVRDTAQERYASADGSVRIPAETICISARS